MGGEEPGAGLGRDKRAIGVAACARERFLEKQVADEIRLDRDVVDGVLGARAKGERVVVVL